MKKKVLFLALALCTVCLFGACNNSSANATPDSQQPVEVESVDIKIGQALYAAHGTKSWAVATVALNGNTVVAAWMDEYQFLTYENTVAVPNADNAEGLGKYLPEDSLLASKRVNWEAYSESMKNAGSTQSLLDNYVALEDFVTGKTVAEVAEAAGLEKEAAVDAVAGCTLVDTKGYLEAFAEAANNAK